VYGQMTRKQRLTSDRPSARSCTEGVGTARSTKACEAEQPCVCAWWYVAAWWTAGCPGFVTHGLYVGNNEREA
jgi:hypothetical protein